MTLLTALLCLSCLAKFLFFCPEDTNQDGEERNLTRLLNEENLVGKKEVKNHIP